ncbi:MAG: ATP-dependent DNA helicase RecG, partial [Candidatus Paceibacterota bacterium]
WQHHLPRSFICDNMKDSLEQPIASLPRTAVRTIQRLQKLDIHTLFDLINHFPSRYEDYSRIIKIHNTPRYTSRSDQYDTGAPKKVTIQGVIDSFTNIPTRRGLHIQKTVVRDDTGSVEVTWFNQPYLQQVLRTGTRVSLSGTISIFGGSYSLKPESFEILHSSTRPIHTARIVPIYPETRGISSRTIREKVYYVLQAYHDKIQELLPKKLVKQHDLTAEDKAYQHVHFPDTKSNIALARTRLAFDEFFVMQMSARLVRQEWERQKVGHKLNTSKYMHLINSFIKTFPFKLTSAQKRSVKEILADLEESHPMNRLLQGDVGSGKTVVAAIAALAVHLNGYQTLVMAPTEILAQQHFETLTRSFANCKQDINISLITSSSKPKKQEIKQGNQVGWQANIIIGTHALISKKASFDNVGLVIVDEQHKFGVTQRADFRKKGTNPHLLSMTATPIPRTVFLTLYGELDVSVIDEMPKKRKKVKTYVVPPRKREDAYAWIKSLIKKEGLQVFIVCPLIEESDKETMQQVRAAKAEYERLKNEVFPNFKVGLLHGKMKAKEKQNAMQKFSNGKLDILVSTPVVEVGVDIPNANIIMIEAAERFGLAQLHQLRGRVGRSEAQAHCLVFTDIQDPAVLKRLETFARVSSGFELAEYDLKRRGAGEMYGTRQHGESALKIASFSQTSLINASQSAVREFMKKKYKIGNYPALGARLASYRIHQISRD